MNAKYVHVSLTVFILFLNCSCRQRTSVDDYEAHENQVFATCCTNDIRLAERSLLDGLQSFSKYKKMQIAGVDFDAKEALYHEGLFLIYRQTQDTNKMKAEFKMSFDCINLSRQHWGQERLQPVTYDAFAHALDLRFPDSKFRWKTNQYFP